MTTSKAKSIKRVLVANRGEIAVRIIRACRELGIETVQVFSEVDRHSLAVHMANRALCIGRARSADTYLNAQYLLSAAKVSGADAIHPGYGFLSENAKFAALCAQEEVTFIGPAPDSIAKMGDKATARRLAAEAGVATTPGSRDIISDVGEAERVAAKIGYPLILKATAGGGGRGMRIISKPDQLRAGLEEASREAKAAFGDGSMYIERYLTNIRHIEIQVLGDGREVLHLGERDCSVQRRNQKLVEESPSPGLSPKVRQRIGEAAIRLCDYIGYVSAGTIEFILNEDDGEFYFMEMNTRIQVEHPVTEMVTGVDLVKQQIQIAAGQPLSLRQDDIKLSGHAIECRVNAEDADRNFAPSPGLVEHYQAPGGPGVRVDSHLFSGYCIPPHYDSLLAKLICWGNTREESVRRMRRALHELRIDGVKTTVQFHLHLLDDEKFTAGRVNTRYVEETLLPRQTIRAPQEVG